MNFILKKLDGNIITVLINEASTGRDLRLKAAEQLDKFPFELTICCGEEVLTDDQLVASFIDKDPFLIVEDGIDLALTWLKSDRQLALTTRWFDGDWLDEPINASAKVEDLEKVQILKLQGKSLGVIEVGYICLLAPYLKNLNDVDLSDNNLGDAGTAILARALPSMSSLMCIQLGGNKIGDAGAASLEQALPSMKCLHQIVLGFNNIGNAGAASLANALPSLTSLARLSLNHNKIGDAGAASLATALPKSLRAPNAVLTIGGNLLGEAAKARLISSAGHVSSVDT